jgi:hypothetical protein
MSRFLSTSLIILAMQMATDVRAASYKDDLEAWISRDLSPYVTQQLITQPRFKNESIRFVILADENAQSVSSKLALSIRDRLRDSVANEPGLRIVWQRDITGASETQNIDCTKDEVHYYVGVEVTEDRGGLVNVDIRALDIEDQSWVAGFSRSWRGYLDATQRRHLHEEAVDPSFRGNRGAPYDESQFDLLAAHLAHELGCALLRQTAGEYIVSGASGNVEDEAESAMLELVSNNLSDFHAAQFSDAQSTANSVIEGKAHQIDDELYQYWITIRPKAVSGELPTLSASAYIRVREKYAIARLIPSITIPLAKSDESFLEPVRVVELRNARLCPSRNSSFQNSRVFNGSYSASATDCYALEVDASDDAVIFFLNHQLNNGLVRLSGKSCDDRTDARIARNDEPLRFPLPIDSLMSDAWAAAADWELNPNRDTYYVVATSNTKAARALSQHIRQLPNRCSASVRSGLEGRDLQHWLDGFSSIAEHWKQSIDWRVVRVKNMY